MCFLKIFLKIKKFKILEVYLAQKKNLNVLDDFNSINIMSVMLCIQ